MPVALMDAPTGSSLETLQPVYDSLMAHAAALPNDELLARMISSQAAGLGALPPGLGLFGPDYVVLLERHFPDAVLPAPTDRPAFDPDVMPERDDLLALLLDHVAGRDDSERRVAEIVAVACMGGDHLWQDLGLWNRADLSRLMNGNFPALAAKNDRDMKWKKFLYRQICEREGIHVCPAPACQVCVDYAKCFGNEG
jgi:nitrogen fixation protein NifQ